MYRLKQPLPFLLLLYVMGCGNPLDKQEALQAEKELEEYIARPDALTAVELIELADCNDLACVQLFMKDLSGFFHGKKGEFSAGLGSIVIDTAGIELIMPLSTFYVDVNPQASWRAAHTIHTKALADTLYNEFKQLGFEFVEEGRYLGIKSKQQRYVSPNYPGKSLYITTTFNPWYFKGLYENKVTWPCYVFEVYVDN